MPKNPRDMSMDEALKVHHTHDYAAMLTANHPKEKGLIGKAVEFIKEHTWDKIPEIGTGQVMGMFKLGAHEWTQVLPALPDSNIRPMEEPGVAFNETMPHVVERDYDQQLDAASLRGRGHEPDLGMER